MVGRFGDKLACFGALDFYIDRRLSIFVELIFVVKLIIVFGLILAWRKGPLVLLNCILESHHSLQCLRTLARYTERIKCPLFNSRLPMVAMVRVRRCLALIQ